MPMKRKSYSKEEIAIEAGATGEQLVGMLTDPVKLEETMKQMFDVAIARELEGMDFSNRVGRRKALKALKKKYKNRRV